jgi:hypothetical protein
LGHPLGTYLTIEGVRLERGKAGTRLLLVDTVNGERLPEPPGIWIDNVTHPGLPSGVRCVLRGCESGKMIGTPHEVLEAEGLASPQPMWQFYRYFVATLVVEPEALQIHRPS